VSRKYFGHAGHLIVASSCIHHIHTHVNGYCVSTVGDYYPDYKRKGDSMGERETIGYGRFLETYVFKLKEGTDDVENYSEIDHEGWQTGEEADAGHEAMVAKYEARQSGSKSDG
jgi:hypothetical protein